MTTALSALQRLKVNPAWVDLLPLDSTAWKPVVRAYQEFKDEPGFTRVVPIEKIRAKEGNLSIPLYVGGGTQARTDAATESATTALPDTVSSWLQSAASVRKQLNALISAK